jgi:hypothetical protein
MLLRLDISDDLLTTSCGNFNGISVNHPATSNRTLQKTLRQGKAIPVTGRGGP